MKIDIASIRRLFGARGMLFGLAIALCVSAYVYVVDHLDPTHNFLVRMFRVGVPEYTFHSGSTAGFYIRIGNEVGKTLQGRDGFRIEHKTSNGGFENAVRLLNQRRAIGLVQESTVPDGDFFQQHLRFVTPLYMERMHVIYDGRKWDQFVKKNKLGPEERPRLTKAPQDRETSTARFLETSRVSSGPVGSGTKILTDYLLSELRISMKNIESYKTADALKRLVYDVGEPGKIDVVFTMAGAPLPEVFTLLRQHPDLHLMSISPSVIPSVNNTFGVHYRLTDLKDKYRGLPVEGRSPQVPDGLTTIGTYAFLITSLDVPSSVVDETLHAIGRSKESIKTAMREAADDGAFQLDNENFQLDEIAFVDSARRAAMSSILARAKEGVVFLTSVGASTFLVFQFLVWVLSSIKVAGYFKRFTMIHKDHYPGRGALAASSAGLPEPEQRSESETRKAVARIAQGIEEMYGIKGVIREDYDTGGLLDTHFNHLMRGLEQNVEEFRSALARSLQDLHLRCEIDGALVGRYYTSGFLRKEDFQDLLNLNGYELVPHRDGRTKAASTPESPSRAGQDQEAR